MLKFIPTYIVTAVDIKEVLLFPAMKPIESVVNPNVANPGPGGQD